MSTTNDPNRTPIPSSFDPHTVHGQLLGAMCLFCKHYVSAPMNAERGNLYRPTCAAFPNGIPTRIMHGDGDRDGWYIPDLHLEPAPEQDNDVVWEKDPLVGDDMLELWDQDREKLLISRQRERAGIPIGMDIDGTMIDPDEM